ncbi:MAG TPA: hypothetical protein VJN89_20160, partial [Candidatus Acidoferrum sp.]|nr:hypothetical protein [Candidatus Acidoferrum sp.]
LNAPPYGLRRVTLRARPATHKVIKTKNKKGDTSNEVRMGTFLKSFDSDTRFTMTFSLLLL